MFGVVKAPERHGNLAVAHVFRSCGVIQHKVSASVGKRNPKLVVLRRSGQLLATIGQVQCTNVASSVSLSF